MNTSNSLKRHLSACMSGLVISFFFAVPSLATSLDIAEGQGTENEPYVISCETEWKSFIQYLNDGNDGSGMYFVLGNSFTVQYSVKYYNAYYTTPCFNFNGSLDGNGDTLSITGNEYAALFDTLGVMGHIRNIYINYEWYKDYEWDWAWREKNAVVCLTNLGVIENVKVRIDNIYAEFYTGFGGLAYTNHGIIAGSDINIDYAYQYQDAKSYMYTMNYLSHDYGVCSYNKRTGLVVNSLVHYKNHSPGASVFKDNEGTVKTGVDEAFVWLSDRCIDNQVVVRGGNLSEKVTSCLLEWKGRNESVWHSQEYLSGGVQTLELDNLNPASIYDARARVQFATGRIITSDTIHIVTRFASAGTDEDPYQITDVYSLCALRDMLSEGERFTSKVVRLMSDIDLLNKPWQPINGVYFEGEFDGNGHVIEHMCVDTCTRYGDSFYYAGFFSEFFGYLHDLAIVDSKVTFRDDYKSQGYSNPATYCSAGGLVGKIRWSSGIDISVERCAFQGSVEGPYYAGGIAGSGKGTIQNCYAVGNVEAAFDQGTVGGIVGVGGSTKVSDCYYVGGLVQPSMQYRESGQISGKADSASVTNCYYNLCTEANMMLDNGTSMSLARMKDGTLLSKLPSGVWYQAAHVNGGLPVLASLAEPRVVTSAPVQSGTDSVQLSGCVIDGVSGCFDKAGFEWTVNGFDFRSHISAVRNREQCTAMLSYDQLSPSDVACRLYAVSGVDTMWGNWENLADPKEQMSILFCETNVSSIKVHYAIPSDWQVETAFVSCLQNDSLLSEKEVPSDGDCCSIPMLDEGVEYTFTLTCILADGSRLTTEPCKATILTHKSSHATDGVASMKDVIYTDNVTVKAGTEVNLPVMMNNQESVSAFMFDVWLPAGFEMVQSEGSYLVGLSPERLASSSSHSIYATRKGSCVRVLCVSPANQSFKDKKGTVANIALKVNEHIAPGTYEVRLANVRMTHPDATSVKYDEVYSCLEVVKYDKGDVNEDGNINSGDYTGVVNLIMNRTTKYLNRLAADVNESGSVDVTDGVGVANYMLYGSFVSPLSPTASAARRDGAVSCYADLTEEISSGTLTFSLDMQNERYTAFQMDVHHPSGIHADNVCWINGRADDSHALRFVNVSDTVTRIFAMSSFNGLFPAGTGAFMTVEWKTADDAAQEDGEWRLGNIKLVDVYMDDLCLPDVYLTSPTRLEDVRATSREAFYDVLGRRVDTPQKGLYITNGKVVMIK